MASEAQPNVFQTAGDDPAECPHLLRGGEIAFVETGIEETLVENARGLVLFGSFRLLSHDCFPNLSIIPIHYIYWLYCLPLGSAALTSIGPPPAEAPPHELSTSIGAPRRESAAFALGWGRRWRRRRSGASRRQRRRPGCGDGAGARVRRGAARLSGASSGVRSTAASLPGAGGREDAEQVDERQQQEPGARVQLHRAAAGRQRVHLHHPGQCRRDPLVTGVWPTWPVTATSEWLPHPKALSAPGCGGRPGCRAPLPEPLSAPGHWALGAASGQVPASRTPNSFPALSRVKSAPFWLPEPAQVGSIFRGRPEGDGQGWSLLPRPPRRGTQALVPRPVKDG